jgi:hypothetical protein
LRKTSYYFAACIGLKISDALLKIQAWAQDRRQVQTVKHYLKRKRKIFDDVLEGYSGRWKIIIDEVIYG